MKRILLFLLVVGLFAGQASAAMYTLDTTLARQFTQLLPLPVSAPDYLNYVIDSPGTAGSTTYYNDLVYGANPNYGFTMQLAVGYVGGITQGTVITIGKNNPGINPGFNSFGASIANDNDDTYKYHLFVSTDNLATKTQSVSATLLGGTQTFLSMAVADFTKVTDIGFDLELLNNPSDVFHTSVVPVPAAVLLGILGLGVVGLKLRKYA